VRKVSTFLLLLVAVAMLPLMAAAQSPAVDVVGNSSAERAIPSGYPARAFPEDVLYDNGPLVTHPQGGYSGADLSALQTVLLMNTYGFGHQYTLNYWMADDFVISDPLGWDLEWLQFFGYQTGTYTYPPVSTFTGLYYEIFLGDPSAGGTLVCGDTTTNMLTSTSWSGAYRAVDYNPIDASRPIMENTAVVAPGCAHLGPGTYWIMWASTGSLGSGPWAPPITILGQTTTGNAMQTLDGGVTWAAALDTGTLTPQGLPFRILGTPTPSLTLHVATVALTKQGTGPWLLTGKGQIHDGFHALAPGVLVQARWTLPSGTKVFRTFTTGAQGGYQFGLNVPAGSAGQFTFCVVGLVKVGYTYVPGDNHMAPNPPCKRVTIP
jgi:hypothetical protein